MNQKLVSAKQLAERYSVHHTTIRKWVRTGMLPVVHINSRCIRFDLEQCDAVIKRRTKNPRLVQPASTSPKSFPTEESPKKQQ